MRRNQIIQIVLLLIAIFAAGLATGRLTAPSGRAYVQRPDGRFVTSDVKLQQLTRQLKLDPKQREQFRGLLEDIAQELAQHPPLSQERLEVFRNSLPRQRALLRPDQQAAFEEMVKKAERRFEQLRAKNKGK